MAARASGSIGVSAATFAAANTESIRKASNNGGRGERPAPSGLRPERPCALLQSLAGFSTRLRLCA
jgi:hypothetical protein